MCIRIERYFGFINFVSFLTLEDMNHIVQRDCLELQTLYLLLKDYGRSPMITYLQIKAEMSEPESALLKMLVRGGNTNINKYKYLKKKNGRKLHRAGSITYDACKFSTGAHQYKPAKGSYQDEKKDQDDTEDQEVKDPEKGEDDIKNGDQEKDIDDRKLYPAGSTTHVARKSSVGAHQYKFAKSSDQEKKGTEDQEDREDPDGRKDQEDMKNVRGTDDQEDRKCQEEDRRARVLKNIKMEIEKKDATSWVAKRLPNLYKNPEQGKKKDQDEKKY